MAAESQQASEKVISPTEDQMRETWDGYTSSLDVWTNTYDQWKKAGEDALKLYAMGIEMATKTLNVDMMKKYNEYWENAWTKSGQENPFSWYTKAWENVWKESGFVSVKSFVDYWQNLWQNASSEAFKNSVEAVKNLNQKWSNTSNE